MSMPDILQRVCIWFGLHVFVCAGLLCVVCASHHYPACMLSRLPAPDIALLPLRSVKKVRQSVTR
jgi:hypothetical protein